jgi:hypothetical protein
MLCSMMREMRSNVWKRGTVIHKSTHQAPTRYIDSGVQNNANDRATTSQHQHWTLYTFDLPQWRFDLPRAFIDRSWKTYMARWTPNSSTQMQSVDHIETIHIPFWPRLSAFLIMNRYSIPCA